MKISKKKDNKFLRVPMVDNKFITKLSVLYEDSIRTIPIMLDTGCTHSNIPYKYFKQFKNDNERLEAKKQAMCRNPYKLALGVESNKENILKLMKGTTLNNQLECKNIVVSERFYSCYIKNIYLGNLDLLTSYDFNGNALIGMEILKNWDIHISKSLLTDKTIFMACPLNKINEEYIKALINEFDIGQKMIDHLLSKIDTQAIEANYVNSTLKNNN